jgi:hypothetical protein
MKVKHTPQTRARAARLVREGKSNPQVASATKTSTATIKRWKKDPDFLSLIHGAAVLTFGHVQIRAAESDVLEHVPCEGELGLDRRRARRRRVRRHRARRSTASPERSTSPELLSTICQESAPSQMP